MAGRLARGILWASSVSLLLGAVLPWLAVWPALSESCRAWYGLVENFFPHFACAAAIVALCLLQLRRRRVAAMPVVVLIATALPILSTVHSAPTAPPGVKTLTVMTYNLWVRQDDTSRLIAYLREERPDIVFLQEATELHKQALTAVRDLYPTQVTCHSGYGACETVLLSRYPAVRQESGSVADAAPPMAMAVLDLGGQQLTAVAVHLAWPFPNHGRDVQREQTLHFADALDRLDGPLLIGGDFNGGSWIRNQRDLRELTGLTAEPGIHPSWPAIPIKGVAVPAPFRLPIDHVMTRRGPVILAARTGPALGSDHLPVLAEIALQP